MRRIRCAIYTRKSTEDGLEQDFNSLDAQREACAAYIASQKHEGWELLDDHYDDGGISGGHLDRPALKRLMQAVEDKQVDQIVVYKIDRLTRSLADFAKLVERLDEQEASFVSVTQSFNTATSMGRLTLNVLLSFAQFEREVTAERIRDKIAASKKKGLWMGGTVPLGYQAQGRTLKIDETEAKTIRNLYDLYVELGCIREVKERADKLDLRTRRRVLGDGRIKGGGPFGRGHIHHILTNSIYAGRIGHKGKVYNGQHPAIIDPDVWDQVQAKLAIASAKPRGTRRLSTVSPLAGIIFDETGDRLTPSHSRKNGKRLRYYISRRLVVDRARKHPDAWRLPAEQLEAQLSELVGEHLGRPEAVTSLIEGLGAAKLILASKKLKSITEPPRRLSLIKRVELQLGEVKVQLCRKAIANTLNCDSSRVEPAGLLIEAPFQLRRRGVELKLHLGAVQPEIDRTLVSKIVAAQRWLAMIVEGKTFAEIAETERVTNRRVQDLMNLAMLAPDVLDAFASGEQPYGLTSRYLIRSDIPALWSDQSAQFAAL